MKRWFIPAAARARGQSNDLNREILASSLFNCHKEVINAPPVPSISRCIHIVYRHKNVWKYQWSNFIYKCMSTFLNNVRCKDALLDCSAPGGERCESLTWVDEITYPFSKLSATVEIFKLIHVSKPHLRNTAYSRARTPPKEMTTIRRLFTMLALLLMIGIVHKKYLSKRFEQRLPSQRLPLFRRQIADPM